MKGTIVKCLEELVIARFGKDRWEKSLEDAGLSRSTFFWPMGDVDDAQVTRVIEAVCDNLNISLAQAADAFGDYWVNVYAQKMYRVFFMRNKTASDFLLDINDVHMEMTRAVNDARPPGPRPTGSTIASSRGSATRSVPRAASSFLWATGSTAWRNSSRPCTCAAWKTFS